MAQATPPGFSGAGIYTVTELGVYVMRIVILIVCGIMLVSCSRATGSSPVPAGMPNDSTHATETSRGLALHPLTGSGYESIYSFNGSPTDGSAPFAPLVAVNGTLYGTTFEGGRSGCTDGCGMIFAVDTSGTETVLHRFKGGKDGAGPFGGLITVNGALYGTTSGGGASGAGTVFTVSTSGEERVLYSFKGGSDGANPYGSLLAANGVLYGTTEFGGDSQCAIRPSEPTCGTVYTVSTSGEERVLYSFKGGSDGVLPVAGLIALNGTLYGTTSGGGSTDCAYGCGTVFAVNTSGAESVLYSFKGGSDGADPMAGLLNVKGTLYGTTYEGGAYSECGYGCGTVFAVKRPVRNACCIASEAVRMVRARSMGVV